MSLIGGATAIFVFIAGFFYERVYRPRLGWWALIARRAGLLLPPYLFISLVLVASGLEPGVRGMEPVTADPLAKLGLWLLTGTAGPATWFVPFFLLLLLFTPLFARFALAGVRVQLALLAALLLLAFVVPRDPLMVLANVAHFAFYYALGIFWAIHRATIEQALKRRGVLAGFIAALMVAAAVQYAFGIPAGYGAPEPLVSARDLVVLRKFLLIVILMGLLQRLGDRRVALLSFIAARSFGLFFVHQPVLLWLTRSFAAQGAAMENPWALALLLWGGTLALSLAVLELAHALLGARAKLLLGA